MFNNSPEPPYYAVIFTSRLAQKESAEYGEMAQEMGDLAKKQEGFLGVESVRGEDGCGITVSYWKTLEAIDRWKNDLRHREAQRRGKTEWYSAFSLRVCTVERDRFFAKSGAENESRD